jgi:DNA-binding LacI/PurR family transcriptional regulator
MVVASGVEADYIKIQGGKAMRGRCTLKDIAKATGYAKATISNVLNNHKTCFASEETRRKIRAAVVRLGYRPDHFARSLRRRESKIIGILGRSVSGDVQNGQISAIQEAFREAGYLAAYAWGGLDNLESIEDFAKFNADGIVFFDDRDEKAPHLNVPESLRCVCVGSFPFEGIPTVVIDRTEAMRRVVQYLVGLGHRRIVMTMPKPKYSVGRIAGYRTGMEEAGLKSEVRLVKLTEEWGRISALVKERADDFRSATAVVTNSDFVAAEVLGGLREIGLRVPEDCSLVGFNGARVSLTVVPKLTTCRQPREEVARAVVQMLLARVRGESPISQSIVPDLVFRESVAPPPK